MDSDKIEVERDVWNTIVVIMYAEHEADIGPIWERDGGTPATSLVTWIKDINAEQKKAKP